MNNIRKNDAITPVTLKSDLIRSTNKMQQCSFELNRSKNNENNYKFNVVVKTHKYDKPHSEMQEIMINIDKDGLVKKAALSNSLTKETDPLDKKPSKKPKDPPKPKISTKPISVIDNRYFFVYTNNINCAKLGHTIHEDKAVVEVAQFRGGAPYIQKYTIPICVCKKCRAYYISESVYREMKSKGAFLHNLISESDFKKTKFDGLILSEHIMYKFGYNVKENGPSAKQRHLLLDQLIESNIVSKKEAVNHIKGLIKRNKFKNNMSNAVKKWEDDIEYLTGERLKIGVKAIVVSDNILKSSSNKYPNY